ncbi:MAG TPA: glycosyltransferase [Vicinamibacteria bacterium]|jgi:glycosyltransferase involved in cell wall biosynthesis|nr:glycosyltransferase [Vicinamibacteria bacterium]
MRRVLMVCYYFPPLGGVGSLRALKFATYLPEFGWEPTVLAPRNGTYFRDPTLAFPEEKVIRTLSLEISRWGKRAVGSTSGDTEPAAVGPLLHRVRAFVRRWIYRPDPQVGWYPFAVHSARRALREGRFDAIFSSSVPITAHVIAARLQRDSGLPWLAEFRDPWSEYLGPQDPRRAAARRLEVAILQKARAVVVPSPEWAELFSAKGAREVAVITNGFDPADFGSPSPRPQFTITHVGSFYPEKQDLSAAWAALALLRESGQAPGLRLRFVGEIDPRLRAQIADHGLDDVLEVTGFLPYRAVLEEMGRSSALLLAGGRDDRPSLKGMIPAKVFEYLATGLPIIYVGDLRTDVAGLLRSHVGCHLVAPGDTEEARQALLQAVAERLVSRELADFTRRELTARLARTLEDVCR